MTFHEVAITRGPGDVILVTGLENIMTAMKVLREAIDTGHLPSGSIVDIYRDIQVPGKVLATLLRKLRQPYGWVVPGNNYKITLMKT